ncbi:hypothetical protein Ahia01_001013500 [Argonauta hians]
MNQISSSTDLVQDCPLGWEHFRNNCYEFKFLPLKSFESADLSCQTNGAILLTIDNEDEHAFIVKILKTKFFGRNKWYTDGMVDPSNSKTYIWRGNGKQIENHNQHWIDVSEQKKEGTRIVYVAKGTSYGWSLTNEYAAHSSICKIAQSEIYRIKQRMRDFNFGYGLIDPQNIKRGPNMTIESPNYIVLEGVTRTSFECVATGNPAVKYKWYRLNKATQTKTVGYTRRLKQYFDEMRPSLAHLTPKQLRQQVHNFLKKKKSPECNVNSNNNERSMDIVNDRNTTTSREQSNTTKERTLLLG